MSAREQLVHQFVLLYATAAANLAGVTHDGSLAQPAGGGNCANWILGHLVNVHNAVMQVAGAEPVWQSEQLARAGFEPITGPAEAIEWDTLVERFLGSRDRCLAALGALTDAALEEQVADPFGGVCSRAQLLGTLAYHQAYHAGQLGMARRTAGLPGAVRAPGQVVM
jgi:DinB superfamily